MDGRVELTQNRKATKRFRLWRVVLICGFESVENICANICA
jgi:hypothetical protein